VLLSVVILNFVMLSVIMLSIVRTMIIKLHQLTTNLDIMLLQLEPFIEAENVD